MFGTIKKLKKKIGLIKIAVGLTVLSLLVSSLFFLYYEPEQDSYTINVDFFTDDFTLIHGTLYIPRLLPLFLIEYNGTVPGIVLVHGLGGNHHGLESLAKVFNRNGMIALGIDFRGHGQSLGGFDFVNSPWRNFQANSLKLALDVKAAINFLTTFCKFINSSQIGVYGGSLGGMAAITQGYLEKISNATVSMSMAKLDFLYFINSTHPQNLLLVMGTRDDLFSIEEGMTLFYLACGNKFVPPYKTEGSFSNGTARRLIITPTSHEVVPSFPAVTEEIVKWYRKAFFNTTSGITLSIGLAKYRLIVGSNIYGFLGFFLLIGTISAIISYIKKKKRVNYPLAIGLMRSESNKSKEENQPNLLYLFGIIIFIYFISSIIIHPLAGLFWWIPSIGGNFLASVLVISTILGIFGIYLYSRKLKGFSLKEVIFGKEKLLSALIIGLICFTYVFSITNITSPEFDILRIPNSLSSIIIFSSLFIPFMLIDETLTRIFIQSRYNKDNIAKRMLIAISFTAILKLILFGLIYLWGLIYGWLGISFVDEFVLKLMVPTFMLIIMYYACVYSPFIFETSKKIHASAICSALLLAIDFGMRLTTIIF
ncbi:MAG: alpha/beta hydrolase [Candidatus Helarchaeota archaeon]|nr:alpha/beta hydrolase [Candidatus Helarchaeota archaeon]